MWTRAPTNLTYAYKGRHKSVQTVVSGGYRALNLLEKFTLIEWSLSPRCAPLILVRIRAIVYWSCKQFCRPSGIGFVEIIMIMIPKHAHFSHANWDASQVFLWVKDTPKGATLMQPNATSPYSLSSVWCESSNSRKITRYFSIGPLKRAPTICLGSRVIF